MKSDNAGRKSNVNGIREVADHETVDTDTDESLNIWPEEFSEGEFISINGKSGFINWMKMFLRKWCQFTLINSELFVDAGNVKVKSLEADPNTKINMVILQGWTKDIHPYNKLHNKMCWQ